MLLGAWVVLRAQLRTLPSSLSLETDQGTIPLTA